MYVAAKNVANVPRSSVCKFCDGGGGDTLVTSYIGWKCAANDTLSQLSYVKDAVATNKKVWCTTYRRRKSTHSCKVLILYKGSCADQTHTEPQNYDVICASLEGIVGDRYLSPNGIWIHIFARIGNGMRPTCTHLFVKRSTANGLGIISISLKYIAQRVGEDHLYNI